MAGPKGWLHLRSKGAGKRRFTASSLEEERKEGETEGNLRVSGQLASAGDAGEGG